jgi:hypothetical protein
VGYLGYVHSLAIVNSAAVKMGVQVPHILSGICLGIVLLDHIADLFLIF